MKITISKEELKEIIRIYFIGMEYENQFIKEKKAIKENEIERSNDTYNLLIKLVIEADKNNIELEFMNEINDNLTNQEIINHLIKHRKRTYTSKYWNFE